MTLPGTLMEYVTHRDHRLMRKVNGWYPPRWVRWWALGATRAGDGWLWYLLGLVVLSFGGAARYEAVGAAGLAAGAGIVLFVNLKKAARRRRPHCFQPHCWAALLPPDQFSFPSGHTITAFAVAVAMIQFFPAATFALMFCAVSVAASRIVLGMHFLSDVLAGAAIGTTLALVAACIV